MNDISKIYKREEKRKAHTHTRRVGVAMINTEQDNS